MTAEPLWLSDARGQLGLHETAGPLSTPELEALWRSLPGGAWYWEHFGGDDSKLPWCGAFLAWIMRRQSIGIPQRYASAIEWLRWGRKIDAPAVGCVVVFKRPGGAHVALVIGRREDGWLYCLGGNQKDSVCILAFDPERAEGYRWPLGEPPPPRAALPTLALGVTTSRNEA